MSKLWASRIAAALTAGLAIVIALPAPSHALMLVSRGQEISIGQQVQEEIIAEYGGLSIDRKQTERVQRIGTSIAAVSPRKDVTFSYQLLNSIFINAFSAPGGPCLSRENWPGC